MSPADLFKNRSCRENENILGRVWSKEIIHDTFVHLTHFYGALLNITHHPLLCTSRRLDFENFYVNGAADKKFRALGGSRQRMIYYTVLSDKSVSTMN